jgi:putative flippase GtrA
MGIGVLWGRRELLDAMPPFLRGGEMIDSVRQQDATFAALPHKFEAGTVNGAGAEGLSAAIDYLTKAGFGRIGEIELRLTERELAGLQAIPGVRVLGGAKARDHHGILSFLVDYAVLSLLMFWAFSDSAYSYTHILGIQFSFRALVAAPIARLCSAPVNFLLNRHYVFQAGRDRGAVGRYIVLAVCALVITTVVFAFLDQYVSAAFLHILLKIVIDVAMYMINYRIQKAWVFPQHRTDAPAKGGKK